MTSVPTTSSPDITASLRASSGCTRPRTRTPAATIAATGAAARVAATWSGYRSLDNGGGDILVLDRDGATLADVEYDDESGWPSRADGGGSALEYTGATNIVQLSPDGRYALAFHPARLPANAPAFTQAMALHAPRVLRRGAYPA